MIDIGGVRVGRGEPCRVIAELSCNHNGSVDRAIRMIDAAKASGCDFVKFQAYLPQELVDIRGDGPAPDPWGSQGYTMRALYAKACTPFDWFPKLFDHARSIGIVPFASFFGSQSYYMLKRLGCPAFKLASLDRDHLWLRDLVQGAPLIASVPKREDAGGYVDFLYCPPGYPQTEFAFTPQMFRGEDRWSGGSFLGFSYHGTDIRPSVIAATYGAKLIEAHFQLDDEPGELEANVSLTASQFAALVAELRATEAIIGV